MLIRRLWLHDFRSYEHADVALDDGLTVITGANGAGKTNLLEAIGFLATRRSFRGAPPAALVRDGRSSAVVRAEAERERRELLLETELVLSGRDRFLVNKQPVRRRAALAEAVVITVFTPDDLELVKGGPAARRAWLDDALAVRHPRAGDLQGQVERIVKQRNALLRNHAGRREAALDAEVRSTLSVWDQKLAASGEALAAARADLLAELEPELTKAYHDVAGDTPTISATYAAPWREQGLARALEEARADELRRGVTLVGPHRDEVDLHLAGLPARTHASQGEQRSMALALRLAVHRRLADHLGTPPVLLLDDVVSELDPDRARALLGSLPDGQVLLTTAGPPPEAVRADAVLRVSGGEVRPE